MTLMPLIDMLIKNNLKVNLFGKFEGINYKINFKVYNFGIIEEFARFRTVTFYTLKSEEGNLSETDDFLERMKKESAYSDQIDELYIKY
jgi:hypothetical protein